MSWVAVIATFVTKIWWRWPEDEIKPVNFTLRGKVFIIIILPITFCIIVTVLSVIMCIFSTPYNASIFVPFVKLSNKLCVGL